MADNSHSDGTCAYARTGPNCDTWYAEKVYGIGMWMMHMFTAVTALIFLISCVVQARRLYPQSEFVRILHTLSTKRHLPNEIRFRSREVVILFLSVSSVFYVISSIDPLGWRGRISHAMIMLSFQSVALCNSVAILSAIFTWIKAVDAPLAGWITQHQIYRYSGVAMFAFLVCCNVLAVTDSARAYVYTVSSNIYLLLLGVLINILAWKYGYRVYEVLHQVKDEMKALGVTSTPPTVVPKFKMMRKVFSAADAEPKTHSADVSTPNDYISRQPVNCGKLKGISVRFADEVEVQHISKNSPHALTTHSAVAVTAESAASSHNSTNHQTPVAWVERSQKHPAQFHAPRRSKIFTQLEFTDASKSPIQTEDNRSERRERPAVQRPLLGAIPKPRRQRSGSDLLMTKLIHFIISMVIATLSGVPLLLFSIMHEIRHKECFLSSATPNMGSWVTNMTNLWVHLFMGFSIMRFFWLPEAISARIAPIEMSHSRSVTTSRSRVGRRNFKGAKKKSVRPSGDIFAAGSHAPPQVSDETRTVRPQTPTNIQSRESDDAHYGMLLALVSGAAGSSGTGTVPLEIPACTSQLRGYTSAERAMQGLGNKRRSATDSKSPFVPLIPSPISLSVNHGLHARDSESQKPIMLPPVVPSIGIRAVPHTAYESPV